MYIALLIIVGVVFGLCALAAYFSRNECCEPEFPTVYDWTLVRLPGFFGRGRCRDCGNHDKLQRGRCVDCWLALVCELVSCDQCGRYWQPAEDDSRDICPRCRVLKIGIVPPDDMTDTEKMCKRARALADEPLPPGMIARMGENVTGRPMPMQTVQPEKSRSASDAPELGEVE